MTAAHESLPPPALVTARPKYLAPACPLRGGTPGKLRLKTRHDAREHGADVLRAACVAVSDVELGRHFAMSESGASVAGAQIKSGAKTVTFGEFIALCPLDVVATVLAECLRHRMAHELVCGELDDPRATLLRLFSTRMSEAADLARSLRVVTPNR